MSEISTNTSTENENRYGKTLESIVEQLDPTIKDLSILRNSFTELLTSFRAKLENNDYAEPDIEALVYMLFLLVDDLDNKIIDFKGVCKND